jgi:hypothetical protein
MGFDSRQVQRIFSLRYRDQIGSGTHPATYAMDTGSNFSGVKRPGREADYSHASNAEVRNAWTYPSIPKYDLFRGA